MVKAMKQLQMKTEGTPLGRVLSLTGDFMEIVTKTDGKIRLRVVKARN